MGDPQHWMNEAKKKFDSFGWFSNAKFDEAAELYKKAANLFKVQKQWDEAGNAFMKAAECHMKLNSEYEVAQSYINAAQCYKKTNINEAVRCLRNAISFFVNEGRFSLAAKNQKDIAELFESSDDLESALEAYTTAADYFEGENQPSHANNCLLKVAQYSAQLEQYNKAIDIYERVAANALESNLLKYGAKEHLFKAGLCWLCLGDVISMRKALEKYEGLDHTFSNQREYKLLNQITEALDVGDVEQYTAAVAEYDSISRLDPWKTTLLLRVKNKIKAGDDSNSIC